MKITVSSVLLATLMVAPPSAAFTPVASSRRLVSSVSTSSLSPQALSPQHREPEDDKNKKTTKKKNNPTPVLFKALENIVSANADAMKKPAALVSTALAAALILTLMLGSPDAALAAQSGGRMGGSFGAAPRMSAPTRSYGGGGFYGGGGYRGGVTVAPIITPGPFIMPFSPFGYGFGGGFGFGGGPGVVTVARGPSFFDFLLFGGLTLFVLNAFSSAARGIATSGTDLWTSDATSSALGRGVTVAKISVALDVPNRDDPNSILSVLSRLAQTARTDSRVGVQNLTSQVALELLRRKASIASAYTSSKHFNDKSKAQREFSVIAVQERGKFEQETVSRYGGVDYSSRGDGVGSSSTRGSADAVKATMAVVTLVFAIDGDSTKLPSNIQSVADVEEALRRIASDAKVEDCLQSAEILWTPEDRSETLTLRDVIADYPELRSV